MKKLLSVVLILVIALAAVVAAEAVPSPNFNDKPKFKVIEPDCGLVIREDISEKGKHVAEVEIEVMAEDPAAYFDADEEIAQVIGEGEYTVDELIALYVSGYEESYGDVTVAMYFVTPYEFEEKVAVMYGVVYETEIEDVNEVVWTVIEGEGSEDGAVILTFTGEQLLTAQDGQVLLATISK